MHKHFCRSCLVFTSEAVNCLPLKVCGWSQSEGFPPKLRVLFTRHGPLTRYVKLRVAHAPGMPGPWVSDPDMHHGTCVTHVPWCILGPLTSGFLWSRWRGKRSQHPGACETHSFTYLVRGPCDSLLIRRAFPCHNVAVNALCRCDRLERCMTSIFIDAPEHQQYSNIEPTEFHTIYYRIYCTVHKKKPEWK